MSALTLLVWAALVLCRGSGVLSALLPDPGHQAGKVALNGVNSVETPVNKYVIHECINTTSLAGVFYLESQGQGQTCGLYLFSDADTVIELELEYVNVPCHSGDLVALVDGWEMNGQLWPSSSDHERPLSERTLEYCGTSRPAGRFRSGQNAALLQYRLPTAGAAVSIRVRHVHNPAPCNQLMDEVSEVFTLRNFGRRKNCTLLSMGAVEAQVLPFHVGVAPAGLVRQARAAEQAHKCPEHGWMDYVEMGETTSLDTSSSAISSRLCGHSDLPGPAQSVCNMFVIRMVSSGFFDNVVSVRARLLPIDIRMALCLADYEFPAEYEELLKNYDV